MHYIAAHIFIGGRLSWEYMGDHRYDTDEDGLQISFNLYYKTSEYRFKKFLADVFKQNSIEWIYKDKSGWKLRANDLKTEFPFLATIPGLEGTLSPLVEFENRRVKVFDREEDRAVYKIILTTKSIDEQMPKRIFLSHKGVNKPLVRRFRDALEIVGLQPWLDEEAMHAGTELERGILSGFETSCAAVFFITPEFKDENFLATEVNYALAQKRAKGEKFNIIPLIFRGKRGTTGTIPPLLTPYVHININNELEAFGEIIRALPIKLGELGWR